MNVRETPCQVESGVDWGARWRADIAKTSISENEVYWARRTHGFNVMTNRGGYVTELLGRLELHPGDTVIDMGCGTGSLTIPLAAKGHRVIACDFASGMLTRLEQMALAAGVLENVDLRKLFWFDSWDNLPVADVFVASRSVYARNLQRALLDIEAHARRRCYIAASTYLTPRHDAVMLEAIGRPFRPKSECVYLMNMLAQMGRFPEITYVTQLFPAFGESLEEAREEFERQDGPFTPEESAKLDEFIANNFTTIEDSEGIRMLHRSYRRKVCWAFISWEPMPA